MNIAFTFKNFEPSDHLRKYAERRFGKLKKFLSKSGNIEVSVVLSIDKFRHYADVKLVGDGVHISAIEQSDDMYASVDLALDKVQTQLKKMTDQKHNHRPKNAMGRDFKMDIFNYSASGKKGKRTLVGDDSFEANPLYEDEAMVQLASSDAEFLVFLNSETDHVNVMYRRKNGDFGLINLDI